MYFVILIFIFPYIPFINRSRQWLGSSLNHDVILFLTIRPYGGVVEMREHVLLERDHGGLGLGRQPDGESQGLKLAEELVR